MKKLVKKPESQINTIEKYACNCGCGCLLWFNDSVTRKEAKDSAN